MKSIDGTDALARSRELRTFATDPEKLLWGKLRSRRLEGFKFRRQHWIGNYVADLCAWRRDWLWKPTDRSMAKMKNMTYGAMHICGMRDFGWSGSGTMR